MKSKVRLFWLMIFLQFFIVSNLFAYEVDTHKRITVEAFNLNSLVGWALPTKMCKDSFSTSSPLAGEDKR